MIFSIETRGNTLLGVLKQLTKADHAQMHKAIIEFAESFKKTLTLKGISYERLKNALVPSVTKKDIALLFDTTLIPQVWYGLRVIEQILPHLDKKSTNSFLIGDYGGEDENQPFLYSILRELTDRIEGRFQHSSLYYIVYINNVSDAFLQRLKENQSTMEGLVDILDLTYASYFKEYISHIIGGAFIKAEGFIIQPDSDGTPDSPDHNLIGYPFEKYGFSTKCVPADGYGVFLQYKIERHFFGGDAEDRLFSINAISAAAKEIDNFSLLVEAKKLEYLKSEKTAILKRIDMLGISEDQLAHTLKERLAHNYLFNLEYNDNHKTCKFNTMIEIDPRESTYKRQKILIALEYLPAEERLRLMTLY